MEELFLSPPTFMWVLGIEPRSPGLQSKPCYTLSLLPLPSLWCSMFLYVLHRCCVFMYVLYRCYVYICTLQVLCVGQVICAVVAETDVQAKRATEKIKITYEDLKPVIFTIEVSWAGQAPSKIVKPGLREGSVVKSTDCSYRRPRFYSQHPHDSLQPFVIPVPEDLTPSSGPCRYQACTWHIDIHVG